MHKHPEVYKKLTIVASFHPHVHVYTQCQECFARFKMEGEKSNSFWSKNSVNSQESSSVPGRSTYMYTMYSSIAGTMQWNLFKKDTTATKENVLIREESSFQTEKCVLFVNLGACRGVLIREASSFGRCSLWGVQLYVYIHVCVKQKI